MCTLSGPPTTWSLRPFSPIMRDLAYFSCCIILTFLNILFVLLLYLCSTYTVNISLMTIQYFIFWWARIISCDLNSMLMHAANGLMYYISIIKGNCSISGPFALHTLIVNALDARFRNITLSCDLTIWPVELISQDSSKCSLLFRDVSLSRYHTSIFETIKIRLCHHRHPVIMFFRISTLIFRMLLASAWIRGYSWALYYERSTSHKFVGLYYIEATASVIYTHIWLHSHVQKCLLHALSVGKTKKFTPLRQYDITGFIYVTTFVTIVISAPENPDFPIDCSSISYILRSSYQTILAKSPWDIFKKLWKTIAFSAFQPSRLDANPLSPKTMLVCYWDTWRYFAWKIFPLPDVLFSVTNIVQGEEWVNAPSRLKIYKVSQDFWRVLSDMKILVRS